MQNSENQQFKNNNGSNAEKEQKQKETYMQLLHQYNTLKDATQTLLGALAQAKGLPLKDVYKEYNVPMDE